MKYTLLEMVQRILESMDSDEVNSYADTIESKAVANILQETYYYLTSRMDLPSTHTFFHLEASGDSGKPTLMTVPANVLDIDYVKYRKVSGSDTEWYEVPFCDLKSYVEKNLNLQESSTNVSTTVIPLEGQNFTFKYVTDENPTEYTTVDDTHILFNSLDTSVDTTLTSSKTFCYGRVSPVFTMSDTFTPALDTDQFQLLLNEAKSQAFTELKQMNNAHADRRASKMFVSSQRQKRNIPTGRNTLPTKGYGRNK